MELFAHYKPQQAITLHWCNNQTQRFYRATLQQDLLNDWCLTKSWGSTLTKQGKTVAKFCASWEEGLKMLEQIHSLRLRRGYKMR